MSLPRRFPAITLLLGVALALTSREARAGLLPTFTQDAVPAFTDPGISPEDNFEEVFQGNVVANFNGQFLNPFPNPKPVQVTFDSLSNTTMVKYAGDPVPRDTAQYMTFGYGLNKYTLGIGGSLTFVEDKANTYWTYMQSITGNVPAAGCSMNYNPTLQKATVTITNDPGTFALYSVGYLVTATPYASSSLNRSTLPPGAFNASGIADGTVLGPGSSVSFTISGVLPGQYVTVFADTQFNDGSSYPYFSGHWSEFPTALPEPGTLAGLAAGLAALGIVRCRRLARSQ